MKVLMLCLEFPPVNTTGNYRSAGFARFLSKNNIETIVLTGTVDTQINTFNKKADYTLLNGLEKVKINRFPIKPLSKIWTKGIPNSIRIWWKTTDKIDMRWYYGDNKKKINRLINKEKPDLLYVSLPPFSLSRTAIYLSRKFKIPLITDMRDAWSTWVTSPFSTRFHYQKVFNLEKLLFSNSQVIIGVTPELIEDFRRQHPEIPQDKFITIYNGYDNLNTGRINLSEQNTDLYKIGYIGNFYYNPTVENLMNKKWHLRSGLKKFYFSPRKEEWIYRSPYFFLKSLSLLFKKNPEIQHKVVFEHVGETPPWLLPMLKELELIDNFKSYGFVDKEEVLNIQASWNGILATSEKINNGNHFCLPSKIFDVVNSGKNIFAFVTPGAQLNFLKEYEQVYFFDPDDITANSDKLEKIIQVKSNVSFQKLSTSFNRENQARKLLECLRNVQLSSTKVK